MLEAHTLSVFERELHLEIMGGRRSLYFSQMTQMICIIFQVEEIAVSRENQVLRASQLCCEKILPKHRPQEAEGCLSRLKRETARSFESGMDQVRAEWQAGFKSFNRSIRKGVEGGRWTEGLQRGSWGLML